MNLTFNTEEEFIAFKNILGKKLAAREIQKADNPDFIPSAVMILIMNKNNEAHVFLTKRTRKVRTHKGDVSFPGGMIEKEDANPLSAALRETLEEAGISPEDIEVLGQFDEFYSVTGFHVSTFVGIIDYPYNYKINTAEIEACIEVPISLFYHKKYDKIESFEFQGKDMKVYYYSFAGYIIWGLTARILTDFGQRILAD